MNLSHSFEPLNHVVINRFEISGQTPIVRLIAVSAGGPLTSANVAGLLLGAVGLLLKVCLLAKLRHGVIATKDSRRTDVPK